MLVETLDFSSGKGNSFFLFSPVLWNIQGIKKKKIPKEKNFKGDMEIREINMPTRYFSRFASSGVSLKGYKIKDIPKSLQ